MSETSKPGTEPAVKGQFKGAHAEGEANDPSQCLTRSVVEALDENPVLEAVTLNRSRHTISVATLGKADVPQLTERISERVQRVNAGETPCALLSGNGDCNTCAQPLSENERRKITVQRDEGTVTIARVTCPTAPKFWRWRDIPWPKVVQRDVEFLEHEDEADEWKAQLGAAVLCGLLGLSAFLFRQNSWSVGLFILAYLSGAWFTAQEVWERLQKRAVDVHFLMLAVAAGSASIGAWGEGATLLFLFSLSGALEHFALGRTQREIRSLFREAPRFATTMDAKGQESQTPVETLAAGMRLLIKPGEQFPVDGEVVKGASASDESNLTGEATPVEKQIGDQVLAGTINLWGILEAIVLRPVAESSLQKVIRLIKEAQRQKAPAQRFTDKFGTYYTYLILSLSLAMFFVWWLALGRPAFAGDSAFYRSMTLLVVASPCALVLSIPSAVLAAIAWGARHGILFRGGAAVEKLAEINTVALDKTGTLTTGELRVETVESFPPGKEKEIARLAYSLERLSTHPLARAITRYGKQQQLDSMEFDRFESVAGQGLRAWRQKEEFTLGRRDWVAKSAVNEWTDDAKETAPGFSEVWVRDGALLGRILLRDEIRPQSRLVLEELRQEGLKEVVLTGDRKAAAEHLQRLLKIDDVRAELNPDQKLQAIRAMSENGGRVAMVGDGVNDAPSLAAAHIGVAMGARGSDAALEQADVILMHDRLENFLAAFRLSQRAKRVIRQNLVISLGTVVVLVTLAFFAKIPLTIGVVGHEGSTVVVVMNSLRLLFGKK